MTPAQAFATAAYASLFGTDYLDLAKREELAQLFEEHTNDMRDEITDLHLVAQGIKHYWGCAKNAAHTGLMTDECSRCEAEPMSKEVEQGRECCAALVDDMRNGYAVAEIVAAIRARGAAEEQEK